MRIYRPRGACVLPIREGEYERLFFLDSGAPSSFSRDLDCLDSSPVPGADGWKRLSLPQPPFSLSGLEEILGQRLSGFLGADFFRRFPNLSVAGRRLDLQGTAGGSTEFALQLDSSTSKVAAAIGGTPLEGLVDTGSAECFARELPGGPYAASRGWRLPFSGGETFTVDYFSGVRLALGSGDSCLPWVGTVGVLRPDQMLPNQWRDLPGFVIGQSLLSRYRCTFEVERGRLSLSPTGSPAETWPNPPIFLDEGLYHAGIQVGISGGRAVVTNLLDNCPNSNRVRVNDHIELPGAELSDYEVVNVLDAALSGREPGVVRAIVEGRETELSLAPLFS